MERKDLIRDVLKAAADFNDRRLWTRFTNFDCFAVKVPDRNESMLGVVMGDAGEQFGLSLFRGETAAASLASLTGSDGPGDDVTEAMDMLGFSMDTFGDLSPEAQACVREAGLHPRYTDPVPNCLAKHPGQQPRVPDESELALLLMVMRGAIDADQRKLLEPARLDNPEGVWTLVLSGDPAAPQVSVTRQRWQPAEAPQVIPFPAATPDLAGLPRLDATWLVGLPVLPTGIQGDDRSLLVLLVVDDASEYVFQARLVFAGELRDAIDVLLETFRGGGASGRKGLPRKIVFSSKNLHDAIAPVLRQAGVTCLYMPVVPKLVEIAADLAEHLDAVGPSPSEPPEAAAAQAVPAPDDLAGWKEADRRVGRRFAEYLKFEDRLWSSRAAKRYFGRDDLDSFFETHEQRGVVAAYVAWGILDYRPTKKSRTRAEEMLAEGLPQPEAILLRARIEAHPTLYRVAGHDPKAGTVDLEDVLLGGAVTVHDQLLSENIKNGEFFAGRAFAAGRFHFIELAGPPLGQGMGMEAVGFLQDCGMEFTPDGLRRDAHVLGWLWDWADEWEANWKPPHLCNTDGEDFVWHTASFHVADPAAVRQALLQRKDIEHDEQVDEYVWNRATGRGAEMLGGPVTLGRIEFVGDELVLTVNSAKRFARGRLWLEKLPGVDFLSVTTRRWDEADEDRPMDERIAKPKPVEMTPELTAAAQEFTDRQYMQWLDTPLPILGGKTPRQACATPTGRKQVTMLIRTMPDPMGEGSVRVPRQTMLQALGLGAGPPAPPAPLRMPPGPEGPGIVLPRKKVGRNDPCPCGSGKKFKKCCGR
jgi:hypothetical protein